MQPSFSRRIDNDQDRALGQCAAQRADVGAAIDGVAVQALLGGHVVLGIQEVAGQRDLFPGIGTFSVCRIASLAADYY